MPPVVAIVLGVAGTCISCLNFYLSFIRFPLHRLRGGTREDFQWVSGLPLVGSLLLVIAAAKLTAWPVLMWSALVVSLFDTGGLHWFAAVVLLRWRSMPWRLGKGGIGPRSFSE